MSSIWNGIYEAVAAEDPDYITDFSGLFHLAGNALADQTDRIYDLEGDSYSTPTEQLYSADTDRRCGCASGTLSGDSYHSHGWDGSSTYRLGAEKFAGSTETYSAMTDGPTPTRRFPAAGGQSVVNGKLFSTGGRGAAYYADHDELTISGDSWASKTAYRDGAAYIMQCTTDGRYYLYMGGGYQSGGSVPVEWNRWVLGADSWEELTDSNFARYGAAMAFDEDWGVALMGGNSSAVAAQNDVEQYNPTLDSWAVVTSMGTNQYLGSADRGGDGGFWMGPGDDNDGTQRLYTELDAWAKTTDYYTTTQSYGGGIL